MMQDEYHRIVEILNEFYPNWRKQQGRGLDEIVDFSPWTRLFLGMLRRAVIDYEHGIVDIPDGMISATKIRKKFRVSPNAVATALLSGHIRVVRRKRGTYISEADFAEYIVRNGGLS